MNRIVIPASQTNNKSPVHQITPLMISPSPMAKVALPFLPAIACEAIVLTGPSYAIVPAPGMADVQLFRLPRCPDRPLAARCCNLGIDPRIRILAAVAAIAA